MAQKGFSVKYKKKGTVGPHSTTSYSAKDSAEARKKFSKDYPGYEIVEIKQTWGG